jgi:hypothetical protein
MKFKVSQTCTSDQELRHPFKTNKEAMIWLAENSTEEDLYWILVNLTEYYGDYEGSRDVCEQCGDQAYSEHIWEIEDK